MLQEVGKTIVLLGVGCSPDSRHVEGGVTFVSLIILDEDCLEFVRKSDEFVDSLVTL